MHRYHYSALLNKDYVLLSGHSGPVTCCSFNSDESRLATGSRDKVSQSLYSNMSLCFTFHLFWTYLFIYVFVCIYKGSVLEVLRRIHVDRHSPSSRSIVCGCINIRSLTNKVDDMLEVRRDRSIDVLFVVETWHDVDSTSLSRLPASRRI